MATDAPIGIELGISRVTGAEIVLSNDERRSVTRSAAETANLQNCSSPRWDRTPALLLEVFGAVPGPLHGDQTLGVRRPLLRDHCILYYACNTIDSWADRWTGVMAGSTCWSGTRLPFEWRLKLSPIQGQ